MKKMLSSNKTILRSGPVVCAVNHEYQIMVPVNCETLMRVTVNGREYYCHSNGVRRSDCPVQRFIVPMEELDAAKEYTLHYQKVITRMAYSCIKGRMISKTYSFRPIAASDINVYVLSDCHGLGKEAAQAGSFYGQSLDLLILNGDVSSSCMTIEEAMLPYDIAFEITKGAVPCVITRGNHDLRGKYSERLHELMPTDHGKTYYQIFFGTLWLLVLDCGEDKMDNHREYGGTAAFHTMRIEESEFLEALTCHPDAEFRSGSVCRRIIVSHIPIMYRDRGTSRGEQPFDIENSIYQQWIDRINTAIKPDLYIAGHLHRNAIWQVDAPENSRHIDCPVLITGVPDHGRQKNCSGAALCLHNNQIDVAFTDSKHFVSGKKQMRSSGGAYTL